MQPHPLLYLSQAQESTHQGYSLVLQLKSYTTSDKYPYLSDPLLL